MKKNIKFSSKLPIFTNRCIRTQHLFYRYLLTAFLFLFINHAEARNASDDLSDLLSGFQSLTAIFNQTIYNAKNEPIQKNIGSMALLRPNKFRWEIKDPNPQILVADGAYLWVYDVDLSQVTRQQLDKTKLNSPASLLSGSVIDLKSRFDVTQLTNTPLQSFRLVPNTPGDLFQWIELSFSDKKLVQMRMSDNLGSLSVFHFSNVEINPALRSDFFQFKTPKGVDVIRN